MIVDVGDDAVLTWPNGDDVGPAQVAVTDPAGLVTTVGPVASGSPPGTYRAVYRALVQGRHGVRWSAGTLPGEARVYEDALIVQAPLLRSLVSVADVKAHLRLRTNVDDATLQGFIEAASIVVAHLTGPLVPTEFVEWHDGGGQAISVDNKPIVPGTVTISEFYGTSAFVLTEQPLDGQTSGYAFTVDYVTGQVRRRNFGGGFGIFADGVKNIRITYTAGRPIVPATVQLAVKELVRHLWQNTQVPGRSKVPGTGDGEFAYVMGYAVPNFVVELLQAERRPPGIA